MKKEGYIPVSRKLFEHPFWIEKREFSYAEAWIDLLRLARFESDAAQMLVSGKLISVKRGEYPVSLRYLSEAWKWSKNRVDRFLKLLISEGMITKRTAKGTKQTVITICKYDDYNVSGADRGTKKGQRKDKKGTKKGQRKNEDGTTEGQKEDETNKGNKGKKGNNNPLSLELDFVSEEFREAFSLWLDYKKERKEKYKSPRSLKICYNNLVKLSGNNPAVAIEIVNQSIANNWAGLFALKTENNGNKNTANAADSGNIVIRTTDL